MPNADPKSKSDTKASATKHLYQFFSKPLLGIAGVTLVLAGLFYAAIIWPREINQQQTQSEVYTQQLTLQLNQRLALLESTLNKVAIHEDMAALLTSKKPEHLASTEKSITQSFPFAVRARLTIVGQAKVDPDTYPPLSFAGIDMIQKAERDQLPKPEVHLFEKKKILNFASSIKDGETVVGTLFVSLDFDQFSKGLLNLNGQHGYVSLTQSFDQRNKLQLISGGDARWQNSATSQALTTNNPYWALTFSPAPHPTLFLTSSYAGLIALILLSSFGFIYWGLQTIDLNLRRDSSALIGYSQKILSGYTKLPAFKTIFFESVGHTFERLYSNLPSLLTQAAAISNAPPSAPVITDQETSSQPAPEPKVFNSNALPMAEVAHENKINISATIFRAYDIRGVVPDTLNAEVIQLIGQAIASEALNAGQKALIVARDGRLSGPELSDALIQGILSTGCDVINIGEVPTPLLYFACHKLESQSGVIITGSHNPAEYNGLKIVINGETLSDEKIQHLKTVIDTSNFKSGEGQLSEAEIIPQYLEYISEDVILATSPKVVVDCGNGVAGAVAPQLLTELGCEVIPLYCEVDGNFPNHHPDPSKEENLKDLINAVKDNEADLGLAFDGDGDRIGVVTNTGKIIWPDRLMMLYAKDLLIRNPGADIIFDVKCSRNLAELISSLGGRPLMWKTGHSLIKNKLKETNASLAGEMSGHIFFNDRWFGFDDGLYSAARLLEILTTELQSSDEIFAELPEDLSTPEIAIPVSEENKFSIIEQLTQQGQFGKGKISHLDGVRVDFPKAWGLVRASNTTPTLTARFEAQNPEALQQIQALFKNQLLAVDDSLDLPF